MKRNVRGVRFNAVAADGAVDWDHPQARGLVGWWPSPPGVPAAGGRVLNLADPKGNTHLTITAPTPSAPVWSRAGFAPGYPAYLFDGSTQYASVPSSDLLRPANGITVGFRCRTSSTSGYPIVMRKNDGSGAPVTAWSIALGAAGEGVIWELVTATGYQGTNTSVWALNTDYDVYCVYDGANLIVYQWATKTNVLTTASAAQTLAITYSPDDPLTMGVIGITTASAFLAGQVADPVVWGRGLSQAECAEWSRLRARGFQGADSPLRWLSTRTVFVSSSAFPGDDEYDATPYMTTAW